MLNYRVSPCRTPLFGEVQVPGDKSISHRALLLAALAEGTTQINGLLNGEDCLATLHALRQLGVRIECSDDGQVVVYGQGLYSLQPSKDELYLGNSATAMRLLAGVLAGQAFSGTLTGDRSLLRRPMQRIITPLQHMGARINGTFEGQPPLAIQGQANLTAIDYHVPIASAQVKSCVLFAALYAKGTSTVYPSCITRDHSERLLEQFSYPIDYSKDCISLEGQHRLHATSITIPGDISSAAFFMVAASIIPGSKISLTNVGINETRTGIISILRLMGASIQISESRWLNNEPVADIYIHYAQLQGVRIPQNLIALAIDEFPVLFVAAAYAKGDTILQGASELRVKESDRIDTMANNLKRLGICVKELTDGIVIRGGICEGGEVHSYGDHRVAMALVVAALNAKQQVLITDCTNVVTSFPDFVTTAQQTGMDLMEEASDV